MVKSAEAFRTISEVAEWLGVQTHVLRFWESKFTQVKPVKRAGGRRYYRPTDMLLLGGIKKLLHEDGMTIKGVQKILREEGVAYVSDKSRPLDEVTAAQVDHDVIIGDGAVEVEMTGPADLVAEEAAATEAPVAPEPQDLAEPEPSTPDAPEPAAEEPEEVPAAETPAAVPSFVHSPHVADPEPEIGEQTPEPNLEPQPESTPASGLPSFLSQPSETGTPAPIHDAPKPRIIDVPDVGDVASFEAEPTALSHAVRLRQLSPSQREALRPLVAQLTALRDQMASARRDGR